MTVERHQTPQDVLECTVARFSAALRLLASFGGCGGNP
jgi:hypothetical protein